MAQSDRLLRDMEQIVHRKKGPEIPELYHQAVFPHVSIDGIDEYYGVRLLPNPLLHPALTDCGQAGRVSDVLGQ